LFGQRQVAGSQTEGKNFIDRDHGSGSTAIPVVHFCQFDTQFRANRQQRFFVTRAVAFCEQRDNKDISLFTSSLKLKRFLYHFVELRSLML